MNQKQITIEKNGVRITVSEGLVPSHLKLGWWVVDPQPEPQAESDPEAPHEVEYEPDPEYLEQTRFKRSRKK